jgi:hypothetical protein
VNARMESVDVEGDKHHLCVFKKLLALTTEDIR